MSFLDSARSLAHPSMVEDIDVSAVDQLVKTESQIGGPDNSDSTAEQVYKLLEYLKSVPQHGFVTENDILRETGIDLDIETDLKSSLQKNPSVVCRNEAYRYKAAFDITGVNSLVRELNRNHKGISIDKLSDCYPGVEDDIHRLVMSGVIIGIRSKSNARLKLFPRGPQFLVEISGKANAVEGKACLDVNKDVREEVRRGDVLVLGDGFDVDAEDDPVRYMSRCGRVSVLQNSRGDTKNPLLASFPLLVYNPNPYSASSVKGINEERIQKYGFQWKFTDKKLPLDPPSQVSSQGKRWSLYKHGCTNDIRNIWWEMATKNKFRYPQDEYILDQKMLKANITTQERINQNRAANKRHRAADDKKPRKRGKRKLRKITNMHMIEGGSAEGLM